MFHRGWVRSWLAIHRSGLIRSCLRGLLRLSVTAVLVDYSLLLLRKDASGARSPEVVFVFVRL